MSTKKRLDILTGLLIGSYQKVIGESIETNLTPEQMVDAIINYYENIIDCMPGNVYWLSKNGIALGCNQNVLTMFGLKSIEEFRGLSFAQMGKIGRWSKKAEKKFEEDTLWVVENGLAKLNEEEPPIPTAKGNLIYFLTSRVPLFDKDKNVIGVVGISIDITERKQMELSLLEAKEKAEAANQAKTEFLENMRHDLRTPLSGIIGFAQLIKDESQNTRIAEYAENLVASSHALLVYLNEILEVIRITSDNTLLIKQKFDIQERLKEVILLNQAKAAAKKIQLDLTIDKAVPRYIVGDYKRLHRIALELVSNALNFTEQGHVTVKMSLVEVKEEQIILQLNVTDTGIGIPHDKQTDIFTRFKKLTPSHKGIYPGLGLGLSIVKTFIDDLGGEIYVQSTSQKGTTFTCLFPFQKALVQSADHCHDMLTFSSHDDKLAEFHSQQKPPFFASAYEHKQTSATILLIEDNVIAAQVAQIILKDLACEVDIASNAKEALDYLQQKTYDLIFMDVGLPDMDGYQITRMIRSYKLTTPIIALSAHADIEHKQECIGAGMNAVLTKPLLKEKAADILSAFIPYLISTNTLSNEQALKSSQNETTFVFATLDQYPTLDFDTAQKYIGLDKPMLIQLIQQFQAELTKQKNILTKYFQELRIDLLKIEIHKIKGSASYCGAVQLQKLAEAFMQEIKFAPTLLQQYHKAFVKAITDFESIIL